MVKYFMKAKRASFENFWPDIESIPEAFEGFRLESAESTSCLVISIKFRDGVDQEVALDCKSEF